MADAHHMDAATGINIAFAVAVKEVDPLAVGDFVPFVFDDPVKEMIVFWKFVHGLLSLFPGYWIAL
jgi:hypothetical protein